MQLATQQCSQAILLWGKHIPMLLGVMKMAEGTTVTHAAGQVLALPARPERGGQHEPLRHALRLPPGVGPAHYMGCSDVLGVLIMLTVMHAPHL